MDLYTKCINASSELCHQACSYVRADIEDGSGKPKSQYHNPPSGSSPRSGENVWEDPDKECLFRHVVAFIALVRQDIRKRRLGSNNNREDIIECFVWRRWCLQVYLNSVDAWQFDALCNFVVIVYSFKALALSILSLVDI